MEIRSKKKVKQSRYRPGQAEGSRKLRLPDFVTTARDATAAFTPRKYSWYSFLLEEGFYVNEKSTDTS